MTAACPATHLLAKRLEMIAALPAAGAIIRCDGRDASTIHDLLVQHRGRDVAGRTAITNMPAGHPLGPDGVDRPTFIDPALAAANLTRVARAVAGVLRSVGVPPNNRATPRQAGPWHRPVIAEQPRSITIECRYDPTLRPPFALSAGTGPVVYTEAYHTQDEAFAALPDFAKRVRNGLGVPGSAVGGR